MFDGAGNRTGACHCKAVKFAAIFPESPAPHRCNCSMCTMKSTIVIDLPQEDLTVLEGKESLSYYSFGTGAAKHWFCLVCGIQVFQNLRSDPEKMLVNAACVDGLDIWALESIPIHDGRDRHPSDTGNPRQSPAICQSAEASSRVG